MDGSVWSGYLGHVLSIGYCNYQSLGRGRHRRLLIFVTAADRHSTARNREPESYKISASHSAIIVTLFTSHCCNYSLIIIYSFVIQLFQSNNFISKVTYLLPMSNVERCRDFLIMTF